jgi:hypothetical protein
VDSVVAHHSLRQIPIRLVVSLTVDPAESKRDLNLFGELHSHQLMFLPQLLHPSLQLLASLLLLNSPLH